MPLLGPPRQSFGIVVAIVVAFLVTLFSLLGWTAEWLWMHELGYATVFWRLRGLQIAMFLGMLLIAGLYFTLDLRFLGRIAQRIEASGHAIPTDPSIWAMLRTGGLLVPIIAAILAATFFASSWDDLLRALFARDFGRVDPVFGRDIGFYIFLLPILEKTQNLAAAMTGSVTLVHLMVHHNMGHFRAWPRLDVPTRRTVQTGMAANGAGLRRRLGLGVPPGSVQPAFWQQRCGVRSRLHGRHGGASGAGRDDRGQPSAGRRHRAGRAARPLDLGRARGRRLRPRRGGVVVSDPGGVPAVRRQAQRIGAGSPVSGNATSPSPDSASRSTGSRNANTRSSPA